MKNQTTYTINDLREGRVAVINDGTVEELNKVLEYAFPIDGGGAEGCFKLYYKHHDDPDQWFPAGKVTIPTQSVKVFLDEIEGETKVLLTLENCEFVRCILWFGSKFTEGQVYTKKMLEDEGLLKFTNISNWSFHFSPITEEEYVEELKRIWVSKYPEIKEYDKFIEADGDEYAPPLWGKDNPNKEWEYEKERDRLFNHCLVVYQNGKWAERVTCEDSAQVGENKSVEPLATLDDFCISIKGYNQITKFEVKYILDKKASFNSKELIEAVTVAVNNYLKGKQQ